MNKRYIVTFKNTHEAIRAENVSKENDIAITIVPTPTAITLSCGICIRLEENYIKSFIDLGDKIEYKTIYEQNDREYKELKDKLC